MATGPRSKSHLFIDFYRMADAVNVANFEHKQGADVAVDACATCETKLNKNKRNIFQPINLHSFSFSFLSLHFSLLTHSTPFVLIPPTASSGRNDSCQPPRSWPTPLPGWWRPPRCAPADPLTARARQPLDSHYNTLQYLQVPHNCIGLG